MSAAARHDGNRRWRPWLGFGARFLVRENRERQCEGESENMEKRESEELGAGAPYPRVRLGYKKVEGSIGEEARDRATGVATEVGDDDRMVLHLGPCLLSFSFLLVLSSFLFLFYFLFQLLI